MNFPQTARKLLLVAALCPVIASPLHGDTPERFEPAVEKPSSIPETTVSVMLLAGLTMMMAHRRRLGRR